MPAYVTEYPQFFTASIKGWYKLLEHDQYKDIIVNSIRFLVEDSARSQIFERKVGLGSPVLEEPRLGLPGVREISGE